MPISEELATLLSRSQKESGLVFKTYYREPFTRVKISRAIDEFKSKGLYKPDWNLLDLRHPFGSNFLSKGGTLNELQALMGHGNVFETKILYYGERLHFCSRSGCLCKDPILLFCQFSRFSEFFWHVLGTTLSSKHGL